MKNRPTRWLIVVLTALFLTATHAEVFAADNFKPLIGRWQRSDGGYVIEIRSIAPDGTVEAGYFNPNPINVSRARTGIYKDHIRVEVELRDVGYPGSAYTLVYVSEKDALLGYYWHAVSGQYFDVFFVRMK